MLKEAEAGLAIGELCRKYGISDATYYNWKAKYAGMTASDVKRLRHLEEENRRLKHLVADLTLDNQALKEVISKNF
jgi:putative transposase